MTIKEQILGEPGRDNAVYLEIDSGQSITRLLFDCGYGCLESLAISDIMAIDAAFFSHYHMDHISGFDSLFRFNYNRPEKSLLLAGPTDTTRVLTHRLRGYTWNLVENATGSVILREFTGDTIREVQLATRNGFEEIVSDQTSQDNAVIFTTLDATVSAIELDHGCTSAGYLIREASRTNIDTVRMREMGYLPGPWLKSVKNASLPNDQQVMVGATETTLGELREALLTTTAGSSLAYLTDFRPTSENRQQLVDFIRKVDVLVCENSYCDADKNLAAKNYHLTSTDVGQLASDASVGRLILFHLSDRYSIEEWQNQIDEVKKQFANTYWPENWFAQ